MNRHLRPLYLLIVALALGECTSEKRVCQEKYEPAACSIFFSTLAADASSIGPSMSGILASCAAQLQYQSRCNKESGLPTVLDL